MTVLVAVASKHEATAEIAEAIGRGLREGGVAADVRPVEQADNLSGYAGVVLGSGPLARQVAWGRSAWKRPSSSQAIPSASGTNSNSMAIGEPKALVPLIRGIPPPRSI